MIYPFVCDRCGNRADVILAVAQRNEPVFCSSCVRFQNDGSGCEAVMSRMRREVARPTVHFKGAGWTRTPSIMKDPIAAGHPGQRSNWGVETSADYGDPNLISPYKKTVADHADPVAEEF